MRECANTGQWESPRRRLETCVFPGRHKGGCNELGVVDGRSHPRRWRRHAPTPPAQPGATLRPCASKCTQSLVLVERAGAPGERLMIENLLVEVKNLWFLSFCKLTEVALLQLAKRLLEILHAGKRGIKVKTTFNVTSHDAAIVPLQHGDQQLRLLDFALR